MRGILRRSGVVVVLVLAFLPAACSDSSASPPPVPSTINAEFMTGMWVGALGTHDTLVWAFAADGTLTATDPTGKQPPFAAKWAISGSTLTISANVRGKTNDEPFEGKVLDADHVDLGSKDFGAVFHLRRAVSTSKPAGSPAAPPFDADYLVGGWRGPLGAGNSELGGLDDWDFAADGTATIAGMKVRWEIEGAALKVMSTLSTGKPHVDKFPVRVIDAHHLELDWKDFGGRRILARKPPATQPSGPASAR